MIEARCVGIVLIRYNCMDASHSLIEIMLTEHNHTPSYRMLDDQLDTLRAGQQSYTLIPTVTHITCTCAAEILL